MSKFQNLLKILDQHSVSYNENASLKKYTTFRIGGKTRLLAKVDSSNQLLIAINAAKQIEMPFIVLGKGSNVLVSDNGFDGLVIINQSKKCKILDPKPELTSLKKKASRLTTVSTDIIKPESFQYSDENVPDILVQVDSGTHINILMKALFKKGITGLQWFAGIPSTVGGAIYMNMHGGHHYFGDLVVNAMLFDSEKTKEVDNSYFQFDYDWSILHESREIVLWADLNLKKGDVKRASELAKSWAKLKSNQPQRSAGCIFRNLSEEERLRHKLPTDSVGYLIDKVLNLKGTRIGDAVISENHAAFIENLNSASAADVYNLIRLIIDKARVSLGLDLKMEIELIGDFKE